MTPAEANALAIESELMWLNTLFLYREYEWKKLRAQIPSSGEQPLNELNADPRFKEVAEFESIENLQVPLSSEVVDSPYGRFISHYNCTIVERCAILLSLLPHWTPGALEQYALNFRVAEGICPELALQKSEGGALIPTWTTLFFLVSGTNLLHRSSFFYLLDPDHYFYVHHILRRSQNKPGLPFTGGLLTPERETMELLTVGAVQKPEYNSDFPAREITTEMSWDDLVLAPVTKRQVEEVKVWLRQRKKLFSELGMSRRVKPGYKILFYGSPGTGKTLTACLLGQFTDKPVFRIDLSMIVSKYIGETEKNLAKIFDKAEHSEWILFFDEADALFGARTKVSGSNDRHANQEVSYLLQRIEDYNGIVILASNMKGNIDDAFMRRFSSVVHFPFPKPEERIQLWKRAFPEKLSLSQDVDMKKLSERYEMSGANITNIVAWCALMALEKGDMMVTDSMLREGMARELAKEGRTL